MLAENWGATPAECRRRLPADELLPDAALVLHRAVDVVAPPELVFRWLCQLRVAPYSYDLIDNFGRRSPQQLTPGADRLTAGERVLRIFRLASFEVPVQLTLEHWGVLGRAALTYAVVGRDDGSRLLFRLRWTPPPLLPGPMAALGDLVMARRQLLNFKRLAERDAAAA